MTCEPRSELRLRSIEKTPNRGDAQQARISQPLRDHGEPRKLGRHPEVALGDHIRKEVCAVFLDAIPQRLYRQRVQAGSRPDDHVPRNHVRSRNRTAHRDRIGLVHSSLLLILSHRWPDLGQIREGRDHAAGQIPRDRHHAARRPGLRARGRRLRMGGHLLDRDPVLDGYAVHVLRPGEVQHHPAASARGRADGRNGARRERDLCSDSHGHDRRRDLDPAERVLRRRRAHCFFCSGVARKPEDSVRSPSEPRHSDPMELAKRVRKPLPHHEAKQFSLFIHYWDLVVLVSGRDGDGATAQLCEVVRPRR